MEQPQSGSESDERLLLLSSARFPNLRFTYTAQYSNQGMTPPTVGPVSYLN